MRGTPPAIAVEVGEEPRVTESGTSGTRVILGNAHLTLYGTHRQRQALVVELGKELGLTVSGTDAELIAAASAGVTG